MLASQEGLCFMELDISVCEIYNGSGRVFGELERIWKEAAVA